MCAVKIWLLPCIVIFVIFISMVSTILSANWTLFCEHFVSILKTIVKNKSLACGGIHTLNIHSILFDTKAKRSLLSGYTVENAVF